MSNVSTEETEDSQEILLEETSPKVADREEPSGESSSSSSDGSNESQQREVSSIQDLTQVQSISLQGHTHQDGVENGAARSPHFREAGILLNAASSGSSEHLPTAVESSQQVIQSLSAEEDMSFVQSIHSSVPSANGMILRNQLTLSSQIGEHLNPSQTIEMVNRGPMFPISQTMRNFGNPSFGIFNTYHLPTSNLPPEFRLESSSRLQLPQSQQNSRTTPENGDGGFPFIKTQWTNWPLQNQITMHESSTATGTQEIQFQGLLNQVSGPNKFYPNTGTSSHIQMPNMSIQPGMNPFGTGSSLPFHLEGLSASIQNRGNFVNSNQFEVGESSLRPPKIKMPWEDNNNILPSPNLQLASWLYPPQGSLSQNNIFSTQISGSLRNTVYDPLYEEMGLPVDPHLRIFVGRRDNGNTEE